MTPDYDCGVSQDRTHLLRCCSPLYDVTAARDLPVSSYSGANTRLKYTRELPERDRV